MKSEVYKRKVETPDESLALILDAATCINKQRSIQTNNTLSSHTSCKVH
jgi:hypothetical protein